jgi:hypothetical protein
MPTSQYAPVEKTEVKDRAAALFSVSMLAAIRHPNERNA